MTKKIDVLISCYYDGCTVEKAKSFVERCYGVKVTEEDIQKAVDIIKDCNKVEWK